MNDNNWKSLKKELFLSGFNNNSMPKWEKLAPMPPALNGVDLWNVAVCKVDDSRFVLVGRYDEGTHTNQVFMYHSSSNSWTKLPPYKHRGQKALFLQFCKVVCIKEKVYLLCSDSIDCLDLNASTLEWTFITSNSGFIELESTVVSMHKCIHAFRSRNTMHIFNTVTHQVTTGPSFTKDLVCNYQVVKNGNHLYVVGREETGSPESSKTLIQFLAVDDRSGMPVGQWNILNVPPKQISGFVKVVSVGHCLVVIDNDKNESTGQVGMDCLDLQELRWFNLPAPEIMRIGYRAIALGESQVVVFGGFLTQGASSRDWKYYANMESLQITPEALQPPKPASLFQRCELVLAKQLSLDNIKDARCWAIQQQAPNLLQSCSDFERENGLPVQKSSCKRSRQDFEQEM